MIFQLTSKSRKGSLWFKITDFDELILNMSLDKMLMAQNKMEQNIGWRSCRVNHCLKFELKCEVGRWQSIAYCVSVTKNHDNSALLFIRRSLVTGESHYHLYKILSVTLVTVINWTTVKT